MRPTTASFRITPPMPLRSNCWRYSIAPRSSGPSSEWGRKRSSTDRRLLAAPARRESGLRRSIEGASMPIADDAALAEGVVVTHPDLVNLYGCRIGAQTRIGPFVEIQKNVVV